MTALQPAPEPQALACANSKWLLTSLDGSVARAKATRLSPFSSRYLSAISLSPILTLVKSHVVALPSQAVALVRDVSLVGVSREDVRMNRL